jgi:transcriptional regulator GlxA family with amidase domain
LWPARRNPQVTLPPTANHSGKPHPEISGVLRALVDPPLAQALSLLHATPARDWPVDVLAGLSGSAFYDRFTRAVGEPPTEYLLRWRMILARKALLAPGWSIAPVADPVGYGSEAAFNRAFTRSVVAPPATWRRAQGA